MRKGGTISWFALDPLQMSIGDFAMLRGPNPNAAKVFMNWFLSREGMEAYYEGVPDIPAHPALRSQRRFQGAFVDALMTPRWSVRHFEDDELILPEIRKVWNDLWIG
jgi:hypothetical protein